MSARAFLFAAALAGAAGADAQQVRTFTQFPAGPQSLVYGLPVPLPLDTLTPVDGFRSYASLEARLQGLALESPDVAAHDVGRTLANRTVWAYVVSDEDGTDVEGRPEAAFFVNASTHAREWATPEVSTGTIERMVAGAGDGGLVRYLLDNTRLVIIPVHNIDGFLQTQRYPTEALVGQDPDFPNDWPRDGRMRRKNMRGVDEVLTTTSDHLLGIDLNRNHPPFWATTTGSSNNPNSLLYHGTAAHSEPENTALAAAAQLGPTTRFRLGFDVHTHSKVFFSANTGRARLNAIQAGLIGRLIQHHNVVAGKLYEDLPDPAVQGIGTADEYFASTWLVPSWTLELEPTQSAQEYGGTNVTHSGFILPASQARRVREGWAETNLVAFYMMAGPAHLARVRYVDAQTGAVAAQSRWRYDAATARRIRVDEVAGALVPGRRYRVELGFSKPMRHRDANGEVAPLPGSTLAVAPAVALLQGAARTVLDVSGGAWIDDPARVLRYRDDTYAFEFDAPANVAAYRLEVGAVDMTGHALDSDPSTPADWAQGQWSEYENAAGADGDVGGVDAQTQFSVSEARLIVARAPAALAGEGDAVELEVELPAAAAATTTLAFATGNAFTPLTQWTAGQSDRRTLRFFLPEDAIVQGDRDETLALHLLDGAGASTGVAASLPLRVLDNDSADLAVIHAQLTRQGDFSAAPAGAERALVLERRDYFGPSEPETACQHHQFTGPLTVHGNGATLRPGSSACGLDAAYDGRAGRVELRDLEFAARGAEHASGTASAEVLLQGVGDLSLARVRLHGGELPALQGAAPDVALLRAGAGAVDIVRSRFEERAATGSPAGLRFEDATVTFSESYVRAVDGAALIALDGGSIALRSATLDAGAGAATRALALGGGASASFHASLVQGAGPLCAGAGTSLGFNVFADASCASLQSTDRALPVPLAFDAAARRFAVPNAALDAAGNECSLTDLRGAPQPQSLTGGTVPPRCDTGAFEAGVNPFRGIWGFSQPGQGIDLQTAGNRLFLAWYTHDAAGEPTAYQASAPFTGARWEAVLQQSSRDNASGRVSVADVGSIRIDFTDATHATVNWTIGGASGQDSLTASQFANGEAAIDVTGLWYPPADSGHGATVARRGNVTAIGVYYYDAQGKVRWALGTGSGADAQRMAMTWSSRAGELRPAGSIVAHFRTPRRARFELSLAYPGAAGGSWNRAAADFVPLNDPVDNEDALR